MSPPPTLAKKLQSQYSQGVKHARRLKQYQSNFFRGNLLTAPVEQVVLQVSITDPELERLRCFRYCGHGVRRDH